MTHLTALRALTHWWPAKCTVSCWRRSGEGEGEGGVHTNIKYAFNRFSTIVRQHVVNYICARSAATQRERARLNPFPFPATDTQPPLGAALWHCHSKCSTVCKQICAQFAVFADISGEEEPEGAREEEEEGDVAEAGCMLHVCWLSHIYLKSGKLKGAQGDHPRWTCWSCARLMLKIYVQFWSGWTSLEAACGAIFAAPGFNTWAHTPHSLPTPSSFALPLPSSLCLFHVFNAFLQLDLRQHLDKLQAPSNDTNQLLFVSSSSSSSSFTLHPSSLPYSVSLVACLVIATLAMRHATSLALQLGQVWFS